MENEAPDSPLRDHAQTAQSIPLVELFNALPIAIFVKDTAGRHQYCNNEACRLLNVKAEDLLGKTMHEVYPPEIAEQAHLADAELIRTGETQIYELAMKDEAGRPRVGQVVKTRYLPQDHPEAWIIGCVQDITRRRQAEEVLERQHKLLRTLIDNLPQLIFAKDRTGRFTLANKALAQFMGAGDDPSILLGKTDADFLKPDLWVQSYVDDEEVMRTGERRVNQLEPYEDGEGVQRWNLKTKVPIRGENNEVRGLIGIYSDATLIKRTEEQLRLQAAALESAADGIFISDKTGHILWANSAMMSISGYSMSEIIGKTPKLFTSGQHDPDFFREMWRTLQAGLCWNGEIINKRKSGEIYTEETTITPVQDEDGHVTHFVAIKRDISSRKMLEQEMSRVYAAVAGAYDGILLVAPDDQLLFANRAFTSLLGYHMHDVPEAVYRQITATGEKLVAGEDSLTKRQVDIISLTGTTIPVEIRSWNVASEGHAPLGRVYFVRDLREERRLREEQTMMEVRLRQAQKLEAIGQMAAGIAHEVNTPIQFIGGNVTFVQNAVSDLSRLVKAQQEVIARCASEEDRKALEDLAEEVELDYLEEELPVTFTQSLEGIQRISEIVKAMKDFSHPGTKSRKRMDLNKAVHDAMAVARNEWKYHSEVQLDLAEDLPTVLCLPGEVNQVILNILVNAAHAATDAVVAKKRERGLITLKTEYDKEEVRVRVRDNGKGIPQEIQDRIFEPFFTTKEVGKGTGQGLTIAYDVIVRKHGGRLTFTSKEDEGTEFCIALPLVAKGEEPIAQ